MAGLVQQGMQAPQQGMQQGMQQQAPQESLGGEAATPEEQEQYDRMVLAASSILYDEEAMKGIDKMLGAAVDPAAGITAVVVYLMEVMDEKSGKTLPMDMLPHAAAEVVEMVSEYALKRGIHDVDKATMNRAAQQAMIQLDEKFDFGIEPEDLQAFMQSLDPAQASQMMAEQDAYARGGNG